jgi:flagellar protein FliO/FliZ
MGDVVNLSDYLQFVLALALVLGLIAVLTFAAKRFGLGPVVTARSKHRRLSLAEVLAVDGKRRLVLLRRDDEEHLVLLGPTADLLIEKNIIGGMPKFEDALERVAPNQEPESKQESKEEPESKTQ